MQLPAQRHLDPSVPSTLTAHPGPGVRCSLHGFAHLQCLEADEHIAVSANAVLVDVPDSLSGRADRVGAVDVRAIPHGTTDEMTRCCLALEVRAIASRQG